MQLQGDQAANLARDIRQQLCVLRAATAPAGELPTWLDSFARLSPADGLAPLANALSGMGAHARAIAIFRQIWGRDPDDTEAVRNILNASRAAGDNDTPEIVLRATLSDGGGRLPDPARREFLLQFADVLEHKGDLDGARTALASAVENTPGDTRLLLRLAELHERAGHSDQAIGTYQRLLVMEPGNLAGRLALSTIYENQNRLKDALALFQGGAGADFDARLAILQCKNNQPEAALTTLDRILPPQHITPALGLAAAFSARDDRAHARATVQAALARTTDARLCFPLQCKLIELLTPEDGPVVARRELRRLRRFAATGDNPGLLGSYLDFAAAQATRLKIRQDFVAEARTLWAEGSGPIPAGVAVLLAQLESGEKPGRHRDAPATAGPPGCERFLAANLRRRSGKSRRPRGAGSRPGTHRAGESAQRPEHHQSGARPPSTRPHGRGPRPARNARPARHAGGGQPRQRSRKASWTSATRRGRRRSLPRPRATIATPATGPRCCPTRGSRPRWANLPRRRRPCAPPSACRQMSPTRDRRMDGRRAPARPCGGGSGRLRADRAAGR
ncbi:MAG: tetratricopeptide repeat protein [Chthoniobacter sp.]